jgi:transcriptional regulator with XRE-family HTH domain
MSELRRLRRDADLSQRDFAELLDVPLNTFRMWDSGLRPVPARILVRARAAVERRVQQTELLPLGELAREFGVHLRTLQAAVRTGRLVAQFSVKSVFGRPRRSATRAATEQFMASHYRRFSGQAICPAPLPTVPPDFPNNCGRCVVGSGSRKAVWPSASVPQQSPHISVGITEENTVAGPVATRPVVETDRRHGHENQRDAKLIGTHCVGCHGQANVLIEGWAPDGQMEKNSWICPHCQWETQSWSKAKSLVSRF